MRLHLLLSQLLFVLLLLGNHFCSSQFAVGSNPASDPALLQCSPVWLQWNGSSSKHLEMHSGNGKLGMHNSSMQNMLKLHDNGAA